MLKQNDKVIIYCQDSFNTENAKTAIGFIRYSKIETVGIVDRKSAGRFADEIISGLKKIPIYSSIEEIKQKVKDANVLLIGIALAGGKFPKSWTDDIKNSVKLKMNIVNGLHDFLSDIDEISELAKLNGVYVWDVRKSDSSLTANAKVLNSPIHVVLTVGTDGAIGKMTTSLELTELANKKNIKAKFIATGQTGIMISGEGVPIDALRGDFMAGAVEEEIIKAANEKYEVAFVEGQGSILHPAWSGVTLALLHGSLPHKLILCHKTDRAYIKNTSVKISSLDNFIKLYEDLSLPIRKAKIVGISLNTMGLSDDKAKSIISETERETGLPTDDPVRYSAEKLLKSCQR